MLRFRPSRLRFRLARPLQCSYRHDHDAAVPKTAAVAGGLGSRLHRPLLTAPIKIWSWARGGVVNLTGSGQSLGACLRILRNLCKGTARAATRQGLKAPALRGAGHARPLRQAGVQRLRQTKKTSPSPQKETGPCGSSPWQL